MTFFELGVPFPLFEADAEECPSYRDMGDCPQCGKRGHLFASPDKVACYACLRAGRASYPKNVDPGLTPEQLSELERTPDHQGIDVWPACCKRPMIFIGSTDDKLLPTGPNAIMIGDFAQHGTGWTYCLYHCPNCNTLSARGQK